MPDFFDKMKKVLPCLNKRVVTFQDAARAVRRLKIIVIFLPNLENDGYYIPPEKSLDGKPRIFINASLSERKQTKTLVHEMTHHVNHVALNLVLVSRRKDRNTSLDRQEKYWRNKHEFEAEAIAAISQIPEKDLKNSTRGLFEPIDEDLEEVWEIRLKLRSKYKI